MDAPKLRRRESCSASREQKAERSANPGWPVGGRDSCVIPRVFMKDMKSLLIARSLLLFQPFTACRSQVCVVVRLCS